MLIVGPCLLTLGLAALMFWHAMPLLLGAFALIAVGSGFGLSYSFFTEYVIGLSPEDERDVTAGAIPTLENICVGDRRRPGRLAGQCRGLRRHRRRRYSRLPCR